MKIEETLVEWLSEFIKDTDLFLVSHKVTPTNNYKFFIDGDEGFSLERSIEINRKMRRFIEDEGFYPDGNFSLEVSSPGIDKPLKMLRQYKKNVGRMVLIEMIEDEQEYEGRIIDASEDIVTIETKGTKKQAKQEIALKYTDMKQATIQIEFKK